MRTTDRRTSVPTYQYACTECDHAFEQVQSFSEDSLTVCPRCEGRLRKIFNAVGVVFKGSGFYRTDSRNDANGSGASGSGSSSGSSGAGSSNGSSSNGSDGANGSASASSSSGSAGNGSGGSSGSGDTGPGTSSTTKAAAGAA
jgi:putative FmdB family regulatory protein